MTLRQTLEATVLENFHSPDATHSSWWINPPEMVTAIFEKFALTIDGLVDNEKPGRHFDEEDWERQGWNSALEKIQEVMAETVEKKPWPWVTVLGLRTHNGAPWTRPANDDDLQRLGLTPEELQPKPDIEGRWQY